jgi:hypothetical protein
LIIFSHSFRANRMDDFSTRARREFENDMGDLVNNPEMSDVVFICEDDTGEVRIHAHKLLLISRNPNFEHVLGDQSEIVVKEFTPDIVRKALLLLYKGEVNTVTTSDVVPLFDFATKFDIERLKEFVGKMMSISLGEANVFELVAVAHKYSARDLLADCFVFVVNKGGSIRERYPHTQTHEQTQTHGHAQMQIGRQTYDSLVYPFLIGWMIKQRIYCIHTGRAAPYFVLRLLTFARGCCF